MLEDDPLREKPATHAGAFAARDDCRIIGGYDTDRERVRNFAARWGAEECPSAAELLTGRLRPDVLVIATHPDSHEYYLSRAVAHQIPVVICEKPIAPTRRAAHRMVRLERRGTTRVVINHERRFSRDYVCARRLIQDQTFGRLLALRGQLFFGRTARHDRVFLHDGTHMIDAIHFLTADTLRLRRKIGAYRSGRSSVSLHGNLRLRGIPVSIEVGAERDYLHFELDLSFSGGRIRIGNGIFDWSRSEPSPFYSGYRSLLPLHRYPPEPTGYFAGMAGEAVRLIQDPAARSRSSVADGWEVMRVISTAGRLW